MLTFARRTPTKVSIQMTSLIDMVFLLLIYFLLTSSFVSREGVDVQLPRVARSSGLRSCSWPRSRNRRCGRRGMNGDRGLLRWP